jgi:beta-phosphoglucomutase-like phosphatase (HAD superfamily)
MRAVLLDFNGTMFFDSSLHAEAWSKIYQDLYPEDTKTMDTALVCGPNNDAILKSMAPWLTADERTAWSEKKESLYRRACKTKPEIVHLVSGVEDFLQYLQEHDIPFALASASIKSNIDFFFEIFGLGRWFKKDDVVYDDGTYPNKGAMHLEAARRLGVDVADCLLIEDSPGSIAHAKRNGGGCIVAIGNSAPQSVLFDAGADHYIKDFTEFDCAWLQF